MSTIHISTDIPRSPFLPTLLTLPTLPAPAASSARAKATPRPKKRKRAPQPRTLEDLFGADGQRLITDLFSERADCWQRDRYDKVLFYGEDSAPLWDAWAFFRCSGTILRRAKWRDLFDSISIDLERGLRLLSLTWTPDNLTTEGQHTMEEWRAVFGALLWRVGQHYREFKRRWGVERARELLTLTMDGMWRGEPVPKESPELEYCPRPWLDPWVLAHHNRRSAPRYPVDNIDSVDSVDTVETGSATG